MVKALYHALGADTPKLNNTMWKKAKPIYALTFAKGEDEWTIVRDGRTFGLFDKRLNRVGQFEGIGRVGGVADRINEILGFSVELPTKEGDLQKLWPAYYFLPFYADQDWGWESTWTSFEGLQAIPNYRRHMIDYHLGIRPQAYYDAIREKVDIERRETEAAKKFGDINSVRRSFVERKSVLKLDVDASAFKAEMEELVESYNQFHSRQQDLLTKMKRLKNTLAEIDMDISVLERSIRELTLDYEHSADPETPDDVNCPTCGTTFHNDVSQRFAYLDDISYCDNLIDQKRKERISVSHELRPLEADYATLEKEMRVLDEILERKRGEVRFSEIVRSEGYKEIISSVDHDLQIISEQQEALSAQRQLLADRLKEFGPKKEIRSYYSARMKAYLDELHMVLLEEKDYSDPQKAIRKNVSGSDTPRAMLAQYFAFLAVMKEFNPGVVCPMVIDSPFQQEQDEVNRDAITRFICRHLIPNQQLVLATVDTTGEVGNLVKNPGVNVIKLEVQYGLLEAAQYEETATWLLPLHEETLRTAV